MKTTATSTDEHQLCKCKWLPDPAEYPQSRLFSLDALRGLDMLLLTVLGPLITTMQSSWHCFPAAFMGQFKHGWECFTLWDIIMPLFIFMCGAAMPFALGRRLKDGQGVFWRHVLWRVVLLWVLGGLVQGNWASLDPQRFSPFSNTLQSIAIGYLVVAMVMSFHSRVLAIVAPILLALGYTVVLAVGGYGEWNNPAYRVDQAIFRAMMPADNIWITKPNHYTWFLTSAMFAVMTFAGYHTTLILTKDRGKWQRASQLFAYGAGLLTIGFVSEIWVPCIKPIYTLSFTAQAMGWCVLALDALYVINDIWMVRRGFSLVLLFGQCALTAYFVSHFFRKLLSHMAELVANLPSGVPATDFVVKFIFVLELIAVMAFWRRFRNEWR